MKIKSENLIIENIKLFRIGTSKVRNSSKMTRLFKDIKIFKSKFKIGMEEIKNSNEFLSETKLKVNSIFVSI